MRAEATVTHDILPAGYSITPVWIERSHEIGWRKYHDVRRTASDDHQSDYVRTAITLAVLTGRERSRQTNNQPMALRMRSYRRWKPTWRNSYGGSLLAALHGERGAIYRSALSASASRQKDGAG